MAPPSPGSSTNYIANPKPNGYQSLHTAVIAADGGSLEIQIRTHEMDYIAEYGVAAHWLYKEQGMEVSAQMLEHLARIRRSVQEPTADAEDVRGLIETMRADVFEGRVYTFTPKGKVIDLPKGATPVDFACHIHTEVGHRCRGAPLQALAHLCLSPLNGSLEAQRGRSVRLRRAYCRLLVLLVLLFAFGLRLYDLNARALWFDEGMEYWVAAVGLPDLAESVRVGIQDPPLYSLLLHFWMGGGQNEFYLRFLSVIFSFLSVAGVVRIGYHASGWPAGWMAGVLMALLPPQIRYAQEIGQYALMQCLLVGAVVVLQRLRARSSLSKYLRWLLVALAATYSYYGTVITVLVPFGLVLISALPGKKWTAVKKGILSLVAYFVGILPLILYFLPHQLLRGPTREAFTLHLGAPLVELQSLWLSTQQLIAFQFTGWPWTAVPSSVPLVLVALSLLFAIRERSRLLLWLFVTWGIYYTFGKFGLFPYGYRYGLILTPLLVPAIAQGLSSFLVRKRWRAVGALVLLGLLLLCAASLPNYTLRARLYPEQNWAWPETQELRPLVEHWINNRDDETFTYVYYGAVPAFSYYQQLYDQRTFDHLSPAWYAKCWRGEITGYCQSSGVLYGRGLRKLGSPEKITAVRDALGPSPDSLWLVFSHVYADEDTVILAGFLEEYQILSELEERGASIYLLGK